MDIRAAEISSILKEQIAHFGTEADVSEVGQVLQVGDGVARVHGLDNVQAGRTGRVRRRRQGHGAQPRKRQCRRGDLRRGPRHQRGRRRQAPPARSSTCRSARGCWGAWSIRSAMPSTAKGPIAAESRSRVEVKAPGIVPRQSVHEPMQTGSQGARQPGPDRPRPARAHHRRSSDRQDGHRHRHHHQPEGNQRRRRRGQEAVLHLCRRRAEAVDGRAGGQDPRGGRRHGLHHRRLGDRLGAGAAAVPGALHRLHDGRVFPRQGHARPDHLRRSVQAGGRLSADVAAAAAGRRDARRIQATSSTSIRGCSSAPPR